MPNSNTNVGRKVQSKDEPQIAGFRRDHYLLSLCYSPSGDATYFLASIKQHYLLPRPMEDLSHLVIVMTVRASFDDINNFIERMIELSVVSVRGPTRLSPNIKFKKNSGRTKELYLLKEKSINSHTNLEGSWKAARRSYTHTKIG